jgi:outer membrane lipoprotein-sorting protein
MSWVQQTNGSGQARWNSVASNSDGTKFIACNDTFIWIYNGTSWAQQTVGINEAGWTSVASNDNGTKFIACATRNQFNNSSIWTYNGTSWIQQTVGNSTTSWKSVASNSDGTKFIACAGESIWIYNGTWEQQTVNDSSSLDWRSVASNALGTKFIACADNGSIWIYDNGWNQQITGIGIANWQSVASNALGTKFIACADNGSIWIYDGAWDQQIVPGTARWISVGSNSAGTKFIACSLGKNGGSIWIYNGETWEQQTIDTPVPQWKSVALNSDGTKFIAAENNGSGDGYIYTLSLTTANICFPKGTPVLTDQGLIAIDKIDIEVNTINQKKIVDITKTISEETFLVFFEKDALGLDKPNQETIISHGHKLMYEGEMHPAKWFIKKFVGVKAIPYTGEPLYNVLLETHDTMNVNNLICETLLPDNPVAKFYTKQCKLSIQNRDIMIKILQDCWDRKDYTTYKQILQCC